MGDSLEPIQKRRLLRMTVAHYRQPNVSEEDFHRWVTEKHAAVAAKLHARNGVEGFAVYFAPKSFRGMTADLNALREKHGQTPWVIRNHDAQVEFLFRDMETFFKAAADPDFQALQSEEASYISGIHAEASIGWIETYVHDGRVVNIGEDGKPTYPLFAEVSAAPSLGA